MKYIFTFLLFMFIVYFGVGQIPSNNDPTWVQVWGDEFNYAVNFSTKAAQVNAMNNPTTGKWNYVLCGSGPFKTGEYNGYKSEFGETYAFTIDPSNASNGFVRLGARPTLSTEQYYYPCSLCCSPPSRTLQHPDAIYSAITSFVQFKYGAFELRFRLPDIDLDASTSGIKNTEMVRGYGNAFWLFPSCCPPSSSTRYNEIDWFENNTVDKNNFSTTIHMVPFGREGPLNSNAYVTPDMHVTPHNTGDANFHLKDFTNGKFHTITGVWTPNFINLYLDGEIVVSYGISEKKIGLDGEPMNVIICCISPNGFDKYAAREEQFINLEPGANSFPTSSNPYYMDLDYFRAYHLVEDPTNPSWNVCSSATLAAYDNTVKKNITISSSTCSVNLPITTSTTPFVLRAKEYIDFLENFDSATNENFYAQVQDVE